MLDLKFIRRDPDTVRAAIRDKRVALDLDELLAADVEVTRLRTEVQATQEEQNRLSKSFSTVAPEERKALGEQARALKAQASQLKDDLRDAEERLQLLMWQVPNIPMASAPVGGVDDNVVIKTWGEPPSFDFEPKDHVALLEANDWADFARVTKTCGSRTYGLKNAMVRLELAIHSMVMDKLSARGFTLISVPALAREQALYGTGHFPSHREDVYALDEDLYLSGTAEVVLTGLHSGEILDDAQLPVLYAGYSQCFRREAGSFGKDVRGLLRVHQFVKVEQYIICKNDPEESARWHATLLEGAESVCQDLELPYHVIECATGDMGVGKFRMNDIEVWMPSLQKYRETHSCSTLHAWQARRANIRYRDEDRKVRFAHTLNNTGVATPRILAPLVENHQQADGTVRIPTALRPYMGGAEVLR